MLDLGRYTLSINSANIPEEIKLRMNIPQTLKEHLRGNYFVHDVAIVVYYWATKFDAVLRIAEQTNSEGNTEQVATQFMGNLPHCGKDIVAFKGAMERYGITNPADIYELEDPKFMQTLKTMKKIRERLKDNPEKKHLILYVAAGHGMNLRG